MMDSSDDLGIGKILSSSQEDFLNGVLTESQMIDQNQFSDGYEDLKPYLELPGPMFNGLQLPQQYPQSSTSTLPSTEEYPGPYNFGIDMKGLSTGKSWEFSQPLRKVYIKFNVGFPISFHYDSRVENLSVRALLVFIDPEDSVSVVKRCQHHMAGDEKTNHNFQFTEHVVRVDAVDAFYYLDRDSCRTSVVVPLGRPQPGTGTVTNMYRFVCKNSCPSGMNRRATQIIFTLENAGGEVLGRTKLLVRICSCPKRDKDKDELDAARVKAEITQAYDCQYKCKVKRKTKHPSKKIKLDVINEPWRGTANNFTVIDGFNCLDEQHKSEILANSARFALGSLVARAASEGRGLNARELVLQREYMDRISDGERTAMNSDSQEQ